MVSSHPIDPCCAYAYLEGPPSIRGRSVGEVERSVLIQRQEAIVATIDVLDGVRVYAVIVCPDAPGLVGAAAVMYCH
jgi:hypothetical protein